MDTNIPELFIMGWSCFFFLFLFC